MSTFPVDRSELKRLFATTENALNWGGYFLPYSFQLRAMLSTLQIAGGLFLAGYGACSSLFMDKYERQAAQKEAFEDLTFVVHGAANRLRSEAERQLFFPLSLVLLAWDMSGLRIKYNVEKEAAGYNVTMNQVADKVHWIRKKLDPILSA